VNVRLHLTDDTQLHADGYALEERLFAEVRWGPTHPGSGLGQGALWGTPAAMCQLADAAVQAAIQGEEDACWQAHQAGTAAGEGRVA
jgi:hypothetical protein